MVHDEDGTKADSLIINTDLKDGKILRHFWPLFRLLQKLISQPHEISFG